MNLFLDTNVLVAASVHQHEHHARALPLIAAVLEGRAQGCVSAHSLIEMYAILTRLPRSPRITPAQASMLLEENIVKHFAIVALSAKEYRQFAVNLGRNGVVGGQAYDALHLACVEKAQAEQIYTFNVRHFVELAPHLSPKITAP